MVWNRVNSGVGTCYGCRNDTTKLLAKILQWEASVHSNFVVASSEGIRNSCAECHSSEGYVKRLAGNIAPNKVEEGESNSTPPNCFTCHNIHSYYTNADYGMKTVEPVILYISGKTFNMGKGNLCATCHQPRTPAPTIGGGDVEISSTHWGPYHSVQSAFILGVGGYGKAGSITNSRSSAVTDSCVTCHMVNSNHQMTPDLQTCLACHSEAESFDINGVQTEIQAKLDEIGQLLEDKGLLKDGNPVVGTYPEAEAGALWNYITVESDGSLGIHNPNYTKSLLQTAIDALK